MEWNPAMYVCNCYICRQHGLSEKWYPFEESILVPLIIQDPRMPKRRRGTVSTDFTLSIDLAPTILGAANLPPASFMQGRDVAELYLDEEEEEDAIIEEYDRQLQRRRRPWRKDFFYEYNRGNHTTGEGHNGKGTCDNSFALVSPEWKYIYWREYC
jgi:arylsulfatase